jgi:hypothetical protein
MTKAGPAGKTPDQLAISGAAPATKPALALPEAPRLREQLGAFHFAIAKLRRCSGRVYYHFRMKIQYPPVGSKWKEVDLRVARTVQIVRYDVAKRRVRIACLETERLTWAKLERFNGKSGGYALLSPGTL